jgi:hypothetical protein
MVKLFEQGYGGIFRVKQFDHFLPQSSPYWSSNAQYFEGAKKGPFLFHRVK